MILSTKPSRSRAATTDRKPTAAWRRERAEAPLRSRFGAWLALAALLCMPALSQPHFLVPDSAAHVAWVRSLFFDGDIDFANDYARLGMIEREGDIAFGAPTERGHAGNPFGMGSAFVWAAPVALARLVAQIAAASGARVATDGFGTLLLFAVHCGTWTAAIVAWWATRRAIAQLLPQVPRSAQRLAVVAAALGTTLPYYVLQLPSYAHAPAAAVAAVALALAARQRPRPWSPRGALVLGAVAGLGALVRPQDAVLGFVPLAVAGWSQRQPGAWGHLAAYAAGFAAVAGLQTLAWAHLYGPALVPPQGAGFLGLRGEGLWGVLFASRHGWIAWSPVVAVGAAGWIGLARQPATRTLGGVALVACGLEWLANAAALDWWGGWSFGARRFTTLVPLVALGLAAFLAGGGRWARALAVTAAGLGFVQWVRVATRALSADADPGWAGLWGAEFLGFLPQLPRAAAELAATPWTDLQVLRRPGAPGPDLHADATGVLVAYFSIWWLALAGLTLLATGRRSRAV
jgi:hypothetical protein